MFFYDYYFFYFYCWFLDCVSGMFGKNCSGLCSGYCKDNIICDLRSGYCYDLCVVGFLGDYCNISRYFLCIFIFF